MTVLEHVGMAVAVVGAVLLAALTVRWGRRLRAEDRDPHTPRHKAEVGADLNWWWLNDRS